jgi:cytoskeleton protein RodZ
MAERDEQFTELPLDTPGVRLRRAREAAGFSLADISARTKIAERHLVSLESDNYGALASRAYAVGFARSYARAVDLDEVEIATSVREAMDFNTPPGERHQASSFEPGDPARVPSPRLAWLAGLAALAMVAAGWLYWRSQNAPAANMPDATTEQPVASQPQAAPSEIAPQPSGDVVFTALEPGVWVKFYDSNGAQLMQKQMALGETYTVPANASGPMIWTGRPDALQITIGGQVVPKLAEQEGRMKDVPVTAAALVGRFQVPAVGAIPAAATTGSPAPVAPQPVARTPRAPAPARAPVQSTAAPTLVPVQSPVTPAVETSATAPVAQ